MKSAVARLGPDCAWPDVRPAGVDQGVVSHARLALPHLSSLQRTESAPRTVGVYSVGAAAVSA